MAGWVKALADTNISYNDASFTQSNAGIGSTVLTGVMGDTGALNFSTKFDIKKIIVYGSIIFALIFMFKKR